MSCEICNKEAEQYIDVAYNGEQAAQLCGWDCLIVFALKSNRDWQEHALDEILAEAENASKVIRMAFASGDIHNVLIADSPLDEIAKLVERLKRGSAA